MLSDRKSIESRAKGLKSEQKSPSHSPNQFIYLFSCYRRLNQHCKDLEVVPGLADHCSSLIFNILRSLITVLECSSTNDNESSLSVMSVKFVTFIRVCYLEDEENGELFETFYDSFLKQFEPSEAQWNDASVPAIELEDETEARFFRHSIEYVNRSVVDLAKCEDFSTDYVRYIRLVTLLARSKLVKYLLVRYSFLPEDVRDSFFFLFY